MAEKNELPVVAFLYSYGQSKVVGFSKQPFYRNEQPLTTLAAAQDRIEALEEAHAEFRASLAQALCDDCENGVKWLNEKAAADFARRYPNLNAAMRADAARAGSLGEGVR